MQEGIKFTEGLARMWFLLYSDLISHTQTNTQDTQGLKDLERHINI